MYILFKGIYNKDDYNKIKIISGIVISYSSYYLTRLNFSFSIPTLIDNFQYTKSQLGAVLTAFSLVYGIGKFFSGMLCDITDAKKCIIIGLIGTACINFFIPWGGHSLNFLIILLSLNGCFQSMGWPPCVRLLAYWFDKKEIGKVWGICNSAHAVGSVCTGLLSAYLVTYFNWHYIFYIPALICLIIAFFMSKHLLSHPEEIKNRYYNENKTKDLKSIGFLKETLHKKIFINPIVWCMCLGNMFLYLFRLSILNWLPTFLIEFKNFSLQQAGWQFSGFEILGIAGGICAGVFSDKIHIKHRPNIAISSLIGLAICMLILIINKESYQTVCWICITCTGFFVYSTQILGGIIANDHVPREVAATTTGLVGTFGYLGGALSGVGIGLIADNLGWKGVFVTLFFSNMLCFLCFYIAKNILKNRKNSL